MSGTDSWGQVTPEFVAEVSTRIYLRYLGEKGVRDPEPQSWIHDAENTLIRLEPEKIFVW